MNQWGGEVMVYRTVATRNSESVGGGGGVMVYRTVATRNSESVGG